MRVSNNKQRNALDDWTKQWTLNSIYIETLIRKL